MCGIKQTYLSLCLFFHSLWVCTEDFSLDSLTAVDFHSIEMIEEEQVTGYNKE